MVINKAISFQSQTGIKLKTNKQRKFINQIRLERQKQMNRKAVDELCLAQDILR